MQVAQASLLHAKAESRRLASVNVENVSRCRDVTRLLDSCASECQQHGKGAHGRYGEGSGIACPAQAQPHPAVVGSFISREIDTNCSYVLAELCVLPEMHVLHACSTSKCMHDTQVYRFDRWYLMPVWHHNSLRGFRYSGCHTTNKSRFSQMLLSCFIA